MKMLGAPQAQIASVIYYSIESFAARHKIVNSMTYYFLKTKEHKRIWADETGQMKRIKDANENRNKLAHYSLEFTMHNKKEREDGAILSDFGAPRLRPSSFNLVSQLLGRTPDKDEHNLSPEDVLKYVQEFRDIAEELRSFEDQLDLPEPRLGLALLRRFSLDASAAETDGAGAPDASD